MTIERIEGAFSVCKLADIGGVDLDREFCFLGRTDGEISLVCRTDGVPENTVAREDGWRGFRIQGTLDFSLVGILARIAGLLAERGISIFAVSTYDTDYIFTRSDRHEEALRLLSEAGYDVV